jgi:hypothetical protein
MTRNDVLRELARIVRQDQVAALFVIGWWCAAATDEDLEACLTACKDGVRVWGGEAHLAAYAERWGHLPGPPK